MSKRKYPLLTPPNIITKVEKKSSTIFLTARICFALLLPFLSGNNLLDNNLNTRWSDNGVGSWIQLDLGSKKSICSVDIARLHRHSGRYCTNIGF